MQHLSNFWDFVLLIFTTFVFVAYILVMFQIVVDLFRDRALNGIIKAIWFLGLIFIPFVTAVFYIIFRGRGMSDRQAAALQDARSESDAYIRRVASAKTVTEQIADAKALLDSGAISAEEFSKLKAKVIG